MTVGQVETHKTALVFFFWASRLCWTFLFFSAFFFDEGSLQNEKESMEQARCTLFSYLVLVKLLQSLDASA